MYPRLYRDKAQPVGGRRRGGIVRCANAGNGPLLKRRTARLVEGPIEQGTVTVTGGLTIMRHVLNPAECAGRITVAETHIPQADRGLWPSTPTTFHVVASVGVTCPNGKHVLEEEPLPADNLESLVGGGYIRLQPSPAIQPK
ncbi:MAG: hypothetical protein CME24_21470 [Gemmatimonadetes bacterium]|nr:hypothetical protein [Gemmatimonadota bacterium]